MILAITSCEHKTKAKIDCVTQKILIDKIQTHYASKDREYNSVPFFLIGDESSYLGEYCLSEYNKMYVANFVESRFYDKAILIECSFLTDFIIKLNIAHRQKGKVVMYYSNYNIQMQKMDSIYFHSVVYN